MSVLRQDIINTNAHCMGPPHLAKCSIMYIAPHIASIAATHFYRYAVGTPPKPQLSLGPALMIEFGMACEG